MPVRFFFSKQLSLFHVVVLLLGLSAAMYFILRNQFESKIGGEQHEVSSNSKLNTLRNTHYKFTRPLIAFDLNNESETLYPIKEQLNTIIQQSKSSGNLFDASVYLRDLETGEFITINNDMRYHPGSLIKVPMLMYYLHESETNPAILNKSLTLTNDGRMPSQTFKGQQIEFNKPYTIRELLKYMAAYSDNRATTLLNMYCDVPKFKNVFSDLGLPQPNVTDTNFSMTVHDYSVFMRVLFNATYLTPNNSDLALTLLSESSFKDGIVSKLPSNILVARKFGETFKDEKRELHESGIIYCNNKPYMLIVMTKGYNPQQLAGFISNISDTIFHFFCV
jgi:beta-lactamase class A